MITQERLKQLYRYEPDTGRFIRIYSKQRPDTIGRIAGAPHGNGYLEITIDGRTYYAHRLAWLYMTGAWPKGQIDHKNCIRYDNKWENLRDCTPALN